MLATGWDAKPHIRCRASGTTVEATAFRPGKRNLYQGTNQRVPHNLA